ncbi:MAG TPA: pirin family protein [Acidimicrobiales bacterium]|nr:pirin family protein [Acidimicrobiales bacterium]
MSGPVRSADLADESTSAELLEARITEVGGVPVRRLLPKRTRRTVGAWCFVDHLGPTDVALDIGPHPHIGLHTVTWLLDGEVLHRDSLGSEQAIRPGQLNLMTAGHGIAHSEETPASYRGAHHGVQLWVAQPESTRHGGPAFEHHAELPVVEQPTFTATVLVGELAGARSPARSDTPLVGADLRLRAGRTVLPLDPAFEHAVAVFDGAARVDGHAVEAGTLAYLAPGRDELVLDGDARALLLGGEPFDDTVLMWWNFVARTRGEVDAARADWNSGSDRFGAVASPLDRIPAPQS